MGVGAETGTRVEATFSSFWTTHEARLRRALVAAFGPVDGRAATVEAMTWAWEHWDQVAAMANPAGYLYRVGRTAARRERSRPIPIDAASRQAAGLPPADVDLVRALEKLSPQQRVAVVLVHAYGYPLRDAAEVLEVSVATVREHVARGLKHLRTTLEESDVD